MIPIPTPRNHHKDIQTSPSDLSKIPTVTYCNLIKNSAEYDKKIVRVRAVYFNEFERSYLYDETCEADQPLTAPEKVPAETWVQWDKSLVSQGDSDEAKLNRQLNSFGRKDVTIIGRFDSTNEQGDVNAPNLFGHMNCCRYQFSIIRLEKIIIMPNENNKPDNERVKSPDVFSATPTQADKNAYNARKNKDIECIKRVLSKRFIRLLTEIGKLENKTLNDRLKELIKRPQAQTALVRDEKIYDDEANLEYPDEKGMWIEMSFVKEDGEWKMTLPGEQQ
jgi:hypothetical protein